MKAGGKTGDLFFAELLYLDGQLLGILKKVVHL